VQGEYLLFLTTCRVLTPGWLNAMVEQAQGLRRVQWCSTAMPSTIQHAVVAGIGELQATVTSIFK